MKSETAWLSRRDAEVETGELAGWSAAIELSLADVPPGRYILTMTAEEARTGRRAQRHIPFAVED